ncbi:hypothetical protein BD626DRAFT_484163 [Schizophyllum amplum]|uniref:Uncharacterized protein n=1 Tax=Schizophyllum amplum TaxID=97359 RepID=A0A550CQ58_9AGAR|nr:hypothetical protein BD626DRAFT_484163 [Auriculariopsis ampla]
MPDCMYTDRLKGGAMKTVYSRNQTQGACQQLRDRLGRAPAPADQAGLWTVEQAPEHGHARDSVDAPSVMRFLRFAHS